MFARSNTIQGDPALVDAAIAHVRDEILPTIQETEGCLGLSLIVDRETGRGIATTAWQSEEAMHASAGQAQTMRERAAEVMRGGPTTVEEWETGVMHRVRAAPESACVRCVWARVDPATADRAIDVYKLAILPVLERTAGFCSASLMIDRTSGRAVSSTTYDSRESLEGSRETSRGLRETFVREADAEMLDVGEFELALAHLHLPELV